MTDQKKTKAQLIEELKALRSVAEDMPALICRFLPDGEITYVNNAYCKYFGKTASELIGEKFLTLIPEEDRDGVLSSIASLTVEEPTLTHEHQVIASDGSVCWQQWTNRGLFDDKDRACAYQSIGYDVTERKQAEKMLRDSRERVQALSDASFESIFFSDKGVCLDQNKTAEKTFGYTSSEAIGRLGTEWIVLEDRQMVMDKMLTGCEEAYKATALRKDGTTFPVEIKGRMIDYEGRRVRVTSIRDITARKRAEKLMCTQRDLAHALNSSTTVKDAVELCLETAIEATGMDSGGVYLVDQTTGAMDMVCHRGLSDEFVAGASHFEADSPNTRLVMAGSPAYVQHNQLVKQLGNQPHLEGLRAIGVLPVAHDSRVIACLNVASHTLTEIPETARNLLEAIAAEIGTTISRLRGREALRASEARYRMMFDNTPSAVAVYQAVDDGWDFVFLDFNQAGEKADKIKKDKLIGRKVTEVFSGVEEFGLLDIFRRVWKTGQSEQHPISIYEDNRIAGWRENYIYKLPSGEIVAIYEDVTERKKAEEALAVSQAQYEELFNTVQEGIAIVDENEIIKFANPAYAGIVEVISPGELIGRNLLEFVPEEQHERVHSQTVNRKKGELSQYEINIITAQGNRKTIHVSVSPRFDQDGKYIGEVGAILDISERKRAEGEIRKFKTISDTASYGTAIADLEGNILYVNECFARMHGYERDELLGKPLSIFHTDEHMKSAGCIKQVLQREGSCATVESMHLCRDRREFPILMNGTIIPGEDGSPQFIAATAIDITETRRLQEFAERAQRLEAAGRIAGQVAHDFNNLLGPLVAYPELIKEELGADHKVATYLDAMEVAADQMADINQQLLTLGRRGHYNLRPLNLNTVVSQVLKQLHPRPSTLSIETELCDDLMNVKAGSSQIFRVIANLVSNAVDATDGIGTLAIRSENWYADDIDGNYGQIPRGEYVKLTVTDTGCGIPPEAQDNVFEPFFTTKKASKKRGSGLGLSVVHAVVKDHNGFIDLESQAGMGTSIYIYLPITREQATESDELPAAGGSEKVLVVDDDQIQREVTSRLLRKLGYQVEVVESGEQAVEYLKHQQCDLLLLDMIMPGGIDGTETFRRALKISPGLMAVIVSGYAESDRVGEAQALGAGAFLKKPITLKSIATVVRAELDRVRLPVLVH